MITKVTTALRFILLISCFGSVSARRAQKVVVELPGQNNTSNNKTSDWREWISYTFRPPTPKDVEVGLESRWNQLQQEATSQRRKLSLQVEQFNEHAQATMTQVEETLDSKRKQLKEHIETSIFQQYQGWKRFRTSARAQVGMVLGGCMTFAGGALEQTMPSVQAAQLTWSVLDKHNVTRGLHDPWLKDAAAAVLAVSLVGHAKKETLETTPIERLVPLLTISLTIVESVGIILDNYEGDVSPATRTVTELVAAIAGTAVLSLLPVPIAVVAASVGGAVLLFQSVVSEVVANWFYMLEQGAHKFEQMDREKRRKIEKNVSTQVRKQLEKKLLYPVTNAYNEIQAALRNETLAEPSLQDKVHEAIQHSLKVKVVWSCAAVGVVSQMLWRTKPVERLWTGVRSWWQHVTTPRPKAIKKRRTK